jgi:chromosome segregation ATPase
VTGGQGDLRDLLAKTVEQWALMYPLANWGIWGTADEDSDEQMRAIARKLAARWGDHLADTLRADVQGELDAKDAEIARLTSEVADAEAELAQLEDLPAERDRLRGQSRELERMLADVTAERNSYITELRQHLDEETRLREQVEQLRAIRTLRAMWAKVGVHGMPDQREIFAQCARDLGSIIDRPVETELAEIKEQFAALDQPASPSPQAPDAPQQPEEGS